MIRITSKKDGFRRCGLIHSGTMEYAAGAFPASILARLQAEPMLKVEILPASGSEDVQEEAVMLAEIEPAEPVASCLRQPTKRKS